jgi:hypothetical protein
VGAERSALESGPQLRQRVTEIAPIPGSVDRERQGS